MNSFYILVLVVLLADPQGGMESQSTAIGHGSKEGCENAALLIREQAESMAEANKKVLGHQVACVVVEQKREAPPVPKQEGNVRYY